MQKFGSMLKRDLAGHCLVEAFFLQSEHRLAMISKTHEIVACEDCNRDLLEQLQKKFLQDRSPTLTLNCKHVLVNVSSGIGYIVNDNLHWTHPVRILSRENVEEYMGPGEEMTLVLTH